MTGFEAVYRVTRPLEHPLYQRVSKALKAVESHRALRVLDVGGRRSNYTIGLASQVVVSDLPRHDGTARAALDLGTTEAMRAKIRQRRSNVVDYVIDDMTDTRLPAASFDVVVAVEVLEHVQEDEAFVANVARVLKPGGTFVMTTPNGDFLIRPYADHVRHYRRDQLAALLSRYFDRVSVDYAVNHGPLMKLGVSCHGSTVRKILGTPALGLSYALEQMGVGGDGPRGKRHLVAVAHLT